MTFPKIKLYYKILRIITDIWVLLGFYFLDCKQLTLFINKNSLSNEKTFM